MSGSEAPYTWVETENTVIATSREADLNFGDAVVMDDDEADDDGEEGQAVESLDESVQYNVQSVDSPQSSPSDLGEGALGTGSGQGSVADLYSSACDDDDDDDDDFNPDLANAVLWTRPSESESDDDADDEPARESSEETDRSPKPPSLKQPPAKSPLERGAP